MRIGWLHDQPGYVGGAELTERALRAAAPDGVQIVDCSPGRVAPGLDRYAVHNCVTYSLDDLRGIEGRPAVKLWNDVGGWYDEPVRGWLDSHAQAICLSPLQAEYMGLPDALLIPPAIDLDPFEAAALQSNGDRRGAVCVGSWRNHGKGARVVERWAAENGGVDFYGGGPFAPQASQPVAHAGMPGLLARYETFVFLPQVIEPFGRCAAEAWAAGCTLVVNGLVGAAWWLRERPEALVSAAEDFWEAVLDA